MRRSSEDSNSNKGVKESGGGGNGLGVKKSSVKERNGQEDVEEVEDMETESGSGKVQETLVDKFKKGKVEH